MGLLSSYPAVKALIVELATNQKTLDQHNKLLIDILKKAEARMEPEVILRKDEGGKLVDFGLKQEIEEYLLKEDFDEYAKFISKKGVKDHEVHFLIGRQHFNLIHVLISKTLPMLASKQVPPADPEGHLTHLFNGAQMPQA